MKNEKIMKTAKNLDKFVKFAGGISQTLGIVFLVFAVLVLIFGDAMFDVGSLTLELAYIKFYLADELQTVTGMMKVYTVVGLIAASLICFMADYACKILRRILEPMKESRPFEADIPQNLKKIAWIVLAGGAIVQIIGIAERIFMIQAFPMEKIFSSEAITGIEYVFTIDFGFVLVFCIILFLSYIFSYGQALQQESDETL